MGTTADKLALLQRTKAGQRALLEEMYPDLDFSTVPFREYGRLFTGRKYVPGFVGGWKAYGRSNNEPDGQRNFLPDYSGNGRDIKLFNFAFAGMSGYGGYGSTSWNAYGDNAEQISGNVVNISLERSADNYGGVTPIRLYKGDSVKIRYKITGYQEGCQLRAYTNTRNSEGTMVPNIIRTITADGIYEDTFEWDSVNAATDSSTSQIFIICNYSKAVSAINMTIEQLPLYPGALVSDGVDDYGRCIKGFALPDDYTVVAIRKYIGNVNNSCLVAKRTGAFVLEYYGTAYQTYSYGNAKAITPPALFSYQTKTSYNGVALTPGTSQDADTNALTLFQSYNGGGCAQVALYDLRIYDHTLTAEELQTVKDEMMTDYEKATGGV